MDNRPVAVVSGAGTGIGQATAAALAADGFDVVILGRRPDVLAQAAETLTDAPRAGAVTWHAADLTDPDAVGRCAEAIAARHPVIDVIVNNAGAAAQRVTPEQGLGAMAEGWLMTYQANTVSAVLLTHALEPTLRRPGGRVVLIGSRAATMGGASPAYVAAKSALNGWVLSLAARLGPAGITANVVAPGYTIETELVSGRISLERHGELVSAIAAGRPAVPAEVAAVVRFLASPEASFVNGQVIGVDGGTLPAG